MSQEKNSLAHNILSVVGIVMCVILIPILIINCTLLIKGYTNEDAVPDFAGIAPMIVMTDSMAPVFNGGDLIFVKTAEADEVKAGDVISFFDPQGNGSSVVTHEVLEVVTEGGTLKFRTKGVANPSEDQVLVPAEKLVGVYTDIRIAGAGNVAMFMQTTAGLIVCVVLPLLALIGYDVLRRRAFDKKHAQDKAALLTELAELRKLKAEKEAGSSSEE